MASHGRERGGFDLTPSTLDLLINPFHPSILCVNRVKYQSSLFLLNTFFQRLNSVLPCLYSIPLCLHSIPPCVCVPFQLDSLLERVLDQNLRFTLAFGVGLHHAGLQERDRKTVEKLFVGQKIQVCMYNLPFLTKKVYKLDSSGVCYVVCVKVLRSSLFDRRSLLMSICLCLSCEIKVNSCVCVCDCVIASSGSDSNKYSGVGSQFPRPPGGRQGNGVFRREDAALR